MKTVARILKAILLSPVVGVVLGIATSFIYYFLIAEPEAEHLEGLAKIEFHHWAGHSLELFGFFGGCLGLVWGIGKSVKILIGKRQERTSDSIISWLRVVLNPQDHKQKVAVAMVAGLIGLACGYAIWASSRSLFLEPILFQRSQMDPVVAVTTACDDCFRWSVDTFFVMLIGTLATVFVTYKLLSRALIQKVIA
ncbi:MAG: hypothetical protein ACKVZH_25910 [Blastocatellia bacterium]